VGLAGRRRESSTENAPCRRPLTPCAATGRRSTVFQTLSPATFTHERPALAGEAEDVSRLRLYRRPPGWAAGWNKAVRYLSGTLSRFWFLTPGSPPEMRPTGRPEPRLCGTLLAGHPNLADSRWAHQNPRRRGRNLRGHMPSGGQKTRRLFLVSKLRRFRRGLEDFRRKHCEHANSSQ
jgi:hypothetical protein